MILAYFQDCCNTFSAHFLITDIHLLEGVWYEKAPHEAGQESLSSYEILRNGAVLFIQYIHCR